MAFIAQNLGIAKVGKFPLTGNIHRPFLPDHRNLDLAGEGHFSLYLLGDLKG
jgi:hypothetical protein